MDTEAGDADDDELGQDKDATTPGVTAGGEAGEDAAALYKNFLKKTVTRLCCLCPATKAPPPSSLLAAYTPEVVKGQGVVAPSMGEMAGPFLPDRNGFASQW